jgi:hypothetical protein
MHPFGFVGKWQASVGLFVAAAEGAAVKEE